MSETIAIDVAQIIEQQRFSRFLFWLVGLSGLVMFLDGLDTNLISFAAPYMASDYGLTRVQTGNLFSIHQIGALIGGFVFAYLGDIFGRRPILILMAASFGLLTSAFYFVDHYRAFLLLRLLDGIPLGGMLPLTWALNTEYAPKAYRASIVTLTMVGYSLGTALGGPIANWLSPLFGWKSVFLFGGCGALISAALLFWKLPESVRFLVSKRPVHGAPHGLWNRPAGSARIASLLAWIVPGQPLSANATFHMGDEPPVQDQFRPSLLFQGPLALVTPLIWLAYIASSVAVFFLVSWTPTVLEVLGYTRQQAATASALNSIAGMLGGLALMRFTDRIGIGIVALMPAIGVPLLIAAGTLPLGPKAFLVLLLAIGSVIIGGHFGMHSICGLFYPSAYRGNGAGWAVSIAKLGSMAGPMLGGWALSIYLPVRTIFALLAVWPLLFASSIYFASRILREAKRKSKL